MSWLRLLSVLSVVMLASAAGYPQDSGSDASAKREPGVRGIFADLQSAGLEVLKRTTRLDMLDYWDADSVYKAKNAVDGTSWIETLTPGYMKVAVSPVSTYEIKLLPGKKGDVVMTIYTVGSSTQAPDSEISFYDTDLNPLDRNKYFSAPGLKEFFDIPKGSMTTMKEIREMIPFPTVEYTANGENNSISARLTVGEFMNVDDYNIVKLFLKPEITLDWKGKYKAGGKK